MLRTMFMLVFVASLFPQVPVTTTQKKDNIEIMFVEDGLYVASVGVRVAESVEADTAVVRVFYRTTMSISGKDVELVRSVVDVIPVITDGWVAANAPRVSKDKIVRVEVTLERDLRKTDFKLHETP